MRNKRKLTAATAQTARGSSSSLPVIWLGCSVRCPQRIAFQHGKAHSAEDSGHYNACEWNESFTRARELRASARHRHRDRKSTRLNSSHEWISYAVFCLKKKKKHNKRKNNETKIKNTKCNNNH